MGNKLRLSGGKDGPRKRWIFWCPGCRTHHFFWAGEGSPSWTWNDNLECPTVSPSILVNGSRLEQRCHLFIRGGHLEYLTDCYHSLAGVTVPMDDIDSPATKDEDGDGAEIWDSPEP